jgi:triacylglycerol lipase
MNIVLNHGIFGFDTFQGVHYFNGVAEHLQAMFPDVRVLVPKVPPAGAIFARGDELGRRINRAFDDGTLDDSQPVHIIAHSMGGLDARYLLSPNNSNNMLGRAASLTTISTPHRGSPIADLLVKLLDPGHFSSEESEIGAIILERFRSAGIELGGLSNLTTSEVTLFNSRFADAPDLPKHAVAGVGRGKSFFGIHLNTCRVLRLAYSIIKQVTDEDNDGLVAISSASWGLDPEIWPADHADEIGHDLDHGLHARPSNFDHLARYAALVERLR